MNVAIDDHGRPSRHAPYDRGGWSLGHVGPVPEGLVAWFVAGVVLIAVTLAVGRRLT